jgi:GNAT superfamily N-acetyltransferase
MKSLPSTFDQQISPLPSEGLGEAGEAAVAYLAGIGYEVRYGLTKEYAQAIVDMALEPAIKEYCPNDSGDRFASMEAVERWLSKQRLTFLLLKRADNGELSLAGYGWIGIKDSSHAPGGHVTFSLRVSGNHGGKGLAAPFSTLMVMASAAVFGICDIWLETWASNGAAVHIYHKIGFEDVDAVPGERPTTLEGGGTVQDERLFMTYPNELLPQALQEG